MSVAVCRSSSHGYSSVFAIVLASPNILWTHAKLDGFRSEGYMRSSMICALVFCITPIGCSASDTEWQLSSSQDENPGSISWEQFRTSIQREPWDGGAFIVDGDIRLFGEADLRSFYDTYVAPKTGTLTVRHVLGADVLWSVNQRF